MGENQIVDDLEITVAESKGSVNLVVGGEIDVTTLDRFDRALRDAVYKADEVNLDLSEVTFIGSVGVNSLIRAHQLAVEENITLRILRASTKVERVLELMDLTEYFS